jgi:hypothetical protein
VIAIHFLGVGARGQSTHLENQWSWFVIVKDNQSVGRCAIIVIAQAPTHTPDARRELGLPENPSADIHLVDTLVAEIAVACWPDPMPIIVQSLAHQGFFGSRSAPKIVVDGWRNRRRTIHFSNAGPAFIAQTPRADNLAKVSVAYPLNALSNAAAGTALGARLNNAIVFACSEDSLTAFPNLMRNGLFDVDILARLDGPNGTERMPVVRSGKSNRVDIFVVEQLADIRVAGDAFAQIFALFKFLLESIAVDVTKRHQPSAFYLSHAFDVLSAAATEAHYGKANIAICAKDI